MLVDVRVCACFCSVVAACVPLCTSDFERTFFELTSFSGVCPLTRFDGAFVFMSRG